MSQTVILLAHLLNDRVTTIRDRLQSACHTAGFRFVPLMDNATADSTEWYGSDVEDFRDAGMVNIPYYDCCHHQRLVRIAERLELDADFYWLVEYDVEFTGDWAWLLATPFDSADLVTYNVGVECANDLWRGWDSLQTPVEMTKFRSALQLMRISSRALRRLREIVRNPAWSGMSELVIPTAIASAGLAHRCYEGIAFPDTWRFGPAITPDATRPNTLWHPVK